MNPEYDFKHRDGRRVLLRRHEGESDDQYQFRRREVNRQRAAGRFAFEIEDFVVIDRRLK